MSHSSLLMRWIQMPSHPPPGPPPSSRGEAALLLRPASRLPQGGCKQSPRGEPPAQAGITLFPALSPEGVRTLDVLCTALRRKGWGVGEAERSLTFVWEGEITSWYLQRLLCPLFSNPRHGGKNLVLRIPPGAPCCGGEEQCILGAALWSCGHFWLADSRGCVYL